MLIYRLNSLGLLIWSINTGYDGEIGDTVKANLSSEIIQVVHLKWTDWKRLYGQTLYVRDKENYDRLDLC